MGRDNIFSKKLSVIEDFKFDQKVANVFPDMIQRSIPGYASLISCIGVIANKYVQKNSNIYDLGCSLGAVSLAISHRIKTPGCTIIAVDNSAEMLKKARASLSNELHPIQLKLIEQDINDVAIENASVIVLNFTLQFIDRSLRNKLINRLYAGLLPGGVLVISEKIHLNFKNQKTLDDLHLEFKRDQGYSELEISQKRTSLENVMILDTEEDHIERLQNSGFTEVHRWFQQFNFQSFLAIK